MSIDISADIERKISYNEYEVLINYLSALRIRKI